jgi:hypothetical protein
MGIQDRDYMKRPRDGDDRPSSSGSGSDAEDTLRRILRKYPRLFLYLAIAIGILFAIAMVAAK